MRKVSGACSSPSHEPNTTSSRSAWSAGILRDAPLSALFVADFRGPSQRSSSDWRSSGGLEVDFVRTRADKAVAVEVKAATRWERRDGRALAELAASGRVGRAVGVYRGSHFLEHGDVAVFPVERFLALLHAGEILR